MISMVGKAIRRWWMLFALPTLAAFVIGFLLKGGYGSVDMGAMMACLVLAIVPIIVFYLFCQKHIIAGVTAGAVKG